MSRRIITFGEVDSPDEVQKLAQELFDRQEMTESKVEQLATANEAYNAKVEKYNKDIKPKKTTKKKGFVMSKILIFIVLLVVLFCSVSNAYVATDVSYDIVSNPESLEQYLRDVIGTGTFTFTPQSAPAGNDIIEGKVYYDSSSNALFLSTDGATWTQIDTAGGVSLDGAYNLGNTIDVDGSAVTMTVSDTDNNAALVIAQNDATNDPDGITVTMGALSTGTAIEIDSQSSGTDIAGDNWSVSQAGVGTIVSFVMANGGIINNTTDNEIEFIENSEEFSFAFNGNTLTYATDTGIDTIEFGVLDDLTGIETIAFDGATASTITQTGTGAGDDLTISQAGAVDASLILTSAGTSTTDATQLLATTGSIKINSADNLDVDAADDITVDTAGGAYTLTTIGGDVTLDASDASVIIRGTEEAADAIVIDADGTAGGITVDYGTGNMVITGTGASADFTLDADLISIDGTGVSNITFTNGANEDVTISTAGAADHSLILQATGTAADAFQLITTAGGIDMTNGGASGEDFDIDGVLSAVTINSDEATTDAVDISATAGGITMASTAVASIWTHTATGAADDLTFALAGANDSSIILTSAGTGANAIEITASNAAGDIDINAGDAITVDAGDIIITTDDALGDQFKVDATGVVAGNAINFETTDGGILLNADGANGDIGIDGNASLTLTTAGDLTLAVTGTFDMAGALVKNNRVTTVVDIDGRTLTEAESGSTVIFTMTGAAATCVLPEATANNIGMWFILIDANVTAARDLTIDPEGAGSINGAAAGNFIKNETDNLGEGVYIVSTGADVWYTGLLGHTTAWTVE